MPEVLEILKYTVPSLIVMLTVFFMMRSMARSEDQRRNMELNVAAQKTVLPIRLQAYERIIILLERISPDAVIMRVNQANKTSKDYRAELLTSIKSEFEHNLSQQVYVSRDAWEAVKLARANMINIINNAAQQVKPDASALALSNKILEILMELTTPPNAAAIDLIKKEAQQFF
jgi:hypothetical protein